MPDGAEARRQRHGTAMLQALIELSREAQTGETGSVLAGIREQSELPAQGVFGRMFGPSRQYSRQAAQMLRDLPEGFDPSSDREVRALAGQYGLQPGTKAHETLVSELARIRSNTMLADPAMREGLGLPEGVGTVAEVDTLNKIRQAMGYELRNVTREKGEITSRVSGLTGGAIPVEGAEVKPSSSLLGDLNIEVTEDGLRVSAGRAVGKRTDKWAAEQIEAVGRKSAMEGFASLGNHIMDLVIRNDQAALGNAGDLTAKFRSALKQAGALNVAADYGGARTVEQLIDKATDNEFIENTAELSAGLTPLHFLLATSYAAAQGNKEIGKAELQAAMAATAGVRGGDALQIASTLRESITGLSLSNQSYFKSFKIEEPDLEKLAPYVFQGGLAPPPPKQSSLAPEVQGELGAPPWRGSLDEFRKLHGLE